MKITVLFFLIFSSVIVHAAGPCDAKKLRVIVCVASPPVEEADRYKDGRPCIGDAEPYVKKIEKTVELYPRFIQNAVCDLKRIYIEADGLGPAWSALGNDNDIHSGLVGLRRAELEANLSLAAYQTWFDQQSFGASENFVPIVNGPTVRVRPQNNSLKGWSYSLLHEMGHIFDYQRKFNDQNCQMPNCKPRAQSWTAISWRSIGAPKKSSNFPLRRKICLNNCKGHYVPLSQEQALYNQIFEHGFISQLATVNAMEDFAEFFAAYFASSSMNLHFKIKAGSQIFAIDDELRSKALTSKLKFLETNFPEQ